MPLWLLIRPFWKQIAAGLLVLAVILYARHAWHQQYQDGFNAGIADAEDKQAEVIASRMLENEKRERDLALLVQSKQLELQVKDNANKVLADDVARMANERMRCLSDKVRRSPVSEVTGTAGSGNGAAERSESTSNLGTAIVDIVSECQRSTDKLIVLQEWARAIQ